MNMYDDLKIIDFTQGIAGPFATMLFSELGAKVVKIELPKGDYTRKLGPACSEDNSSLYMSLNWNKETVTLDLESLDGKNKLKSLMEDADIFIVDADSTTEQLIGTTFLNLREKYPSLIICRITQMGDEGPWKEKPVTELELQGLSGLTRYLGEQGEEPVRIGADIANINTAHAAFQGIAASLFKREQTGIGELVTVSLLGTLFSMKSILIAAQDHPDEWEGFHCLAPGDSPDYGFKTKDNPIYFGGPWRNDGSWEKICDYLGLPELGRDERFNTFQKRTPKVRELIPLLEEGFQNFSSEELIENLTKMGAIAIPINDLQNLFNHDQVKANNILKQINYENKTLEVIKVPWNIVEE